MDQRYVDTVRAVKLVMSNLDRLDQELSYGQREELERLLLKLQDRVDVFLEEGDDKMDDVGEE